MSQIFYPFQTCSYPMSYSWSRKKAPATIHPTQNCLWKSQWDFPSSPLFHQDCPWRGELGSSQSLDTTTYHKGWSILGGRAPSTARCKSTSWLRFHGWKTFVWSGSKESITGARLEIWLSVMAFWCLLPQLLRSGKSLIYYRQKSWAYSLAFQIYSHLFKSYRWILIWTFLSTQLRH